MKRKLSCQIPSMKLWIPKNHTRFKWHWEYVTSLQLISLLTSALHVIHLDQQKDLLNYMVCYLCFDHLLSHLWHLQLSRWRTFHSFVPSLYSFNVIKWCTECTVYCVSPHLGSFSLLLLLLPPITSVCVCVWSVRWAEQLLRHKKGWTGHWLAFLFGPSHFWPCVTRTLLLRPQLASARRNSLIWGTGQCVSVCLPSQLNFLSSSLLMRVQH